MQDNTKQEFRPEIELTAAESADLYQMYISNGFRVFNKVCRSEVDKLFIKLVNLSAGDTKNIIANYQVAKAAALFYQGVLVRLDTEAEAFRTTSAPKSKPFDITEGLIDIGELASTQEDYETDYETAFEEGLL